MTTKTTQQPQVQQIATKHDGQKENVFYGEIFYDPDRNVREGNIDIKSAEGRELRSSMVGDGWEDRHDVWGSGAPIKPEELTKCMGIREKRWNFLKAQAEKAKAANAEAGKAVVSDEEIALRIFEALHTKNSELVKPRLLGATGNQRSFVFPFAMFDRLRGGEINGRVIGTDLPNTIQTHIPIFVTQFESERDRLSYMVRENQKEEGFTKMSNGDNLTTAYKLMEMGATQNDLRSQFTDTTGQKLYGLVKIHGMFPRLHLLNRLRNLDHSGKAVVDEEGKRVQVDDFIPYGKLSGPETPKILYRLGPKKELDAYNKRETAKAETKGKTFKPLVAWVEKDVADWIESSVKGDPDAGNKSKIMKKDEIEELTTHSNVGIGVTATAIFKNDKSGLTVLSPAKIGINALVAMGSIDGVQKLNEALLDLSEAKDRDDYTDLCTSVREYVTSLLKPAEAEEAPAPAVEAPKAETAGKGKK